jgi:hypothetical protein
MFFAGIAQSIHASDHHATLHGVVFDILVGSESRVGPCGCVAAPRVALSWRLVAAAGHDLKNAHYRMRLRPEFLPDHEKSAWLGDLDELRRIADSSIRLVHEQVEGKSDESVRLDDLAKAVVEELTGLPIFHPLCVGDGGRFRNDS